MTQFQRLTEHVYWMSPGKPDRPSLAAVVGNQSTLMLDAGASAAHANLFLEQLKEISKPDFVALTHWHWDHVFGAAAIGVPVIAHRETAQKLTVLADYEWSDTALDARVQNGAEIEACAADIKVELPAPRHVQIAPVDILFDEIIELSLGEITCQIKHVGGDHASDSCVMYIPEVRVLFLGDCLYDAIYAPVRHYTRRHLLPLLITLRTFTADYVIEGHNEQIMNQTEFSALLDKFDQALEFIDQHGPETNDKLKQTDLDEDTEYFIRTLVAGQSFETSD